MTMVTRAFTSLAAAVLATAFSGGLVLAAQPSTKDQAVAMVKKAVAYIKTQGPDKAYPAIDDHSGQFGDVTIEIL